MVWEMSELVIKLYPLENHYKTEKNIVIYHSLIYLKSQEVKDFTYF